MENMSINELVISALRKTTEFSDCTIWTVNNHEKYSTLDQVAKTKQSKQLEIFELMRALNVQGIERPNICADTNGKGALQELIGKVGHKLSVLSENKNVHYIEIGPEPIKTYALLKKISGSVGELLYTAIDINETSEPVMREAVIPLLKSEQHFRYIAADYQNISRIDIESEQEVTLITMLGFQEGNELPQTIGNLIRRLSGPETYIISEMQLSIPKEKHHIYTFYQNDNMVKFSQLVCKQLGYLPCGNHCIQIVPVTIFDDVFQVAVTLQSTQNGDHEEYLITNICIKYTLQQFRGIRKSVGGCDVTDEFISGDKTVVYQLAKYAYREKRRMSGLCNLPASLSF